MRIKITSHKDKTLIGQYGTVISQGENFRSIYRVFIESTQQIEYVSRGCFEEVVDNEKATLMLKIDNDLLSKLISQCLELDTSIDSYVETILRINNGR
jgi:hypothetical protein